VALRNPGGVVANGAPAEVLKPERIRDVFGVEPTFIPVEPPGLHLIFD
jgi:ABC-type cobalamin/Fe3+-siderophores transport system ATPase subunit